MLVAICLALSAPAAVAIDQLDDPQPCIEQQAALEGIESKYAAELKDIEEDGQRLEDENHDGHHVSAEVTFKLQRWSFNVPSVTLRPKPMSLNLPQVTMRQRNVSWNMPVTTTKRIGTRINPRVTCRRVRIWPPKVDCTTEWDMVYTDIPVVENKRVEISTNVPEVAYRRTSVVTNIPQFSMRTVQFSTKIPEFKFESPIPQTGPVEVQGKDLQSRGDAVSTRINQDVADLTAALYECHIQDLQAKRTTAANQFKTSIDLVAASISALQAQGIDPSSVEIDGKTENLFKARDDLVREQTEVLASFDKAIDEMLIATRRNVDKAVESTTVSS